MNNPKRGFVVYFDNYPMLLAMPPSSGACCLPP